MTQVRKEKQVIESSVGSRHPKRQYAPGDDEDAKAPARISSATMLVVMQAALLLLLPLAAAACPCPPATASSKVCGSDHRTYDSDCHLECAAVPGLSLLHPGPCSSPVDGTLLTGGTSSSPRRSATEEVKKWEACNNERQCGAATCAECGKDDALCKHMCTVNCWCGCGGHPRGGLDFDLWRKCYDETGCKGRRSACERGCGTQARGECGDQCLLDENKCLCECVQQAGAAGAPAKVATSTGSTRATTEEPRPA